MLPIFQNSKSIYTERGLILFSLFTISLAGSGQAVGDYQTNATGSWDWNTAANWQQCVTAGTWAGATSTSYPGQNSGAGVVNILDNTTVTITASPAYSIAALRIDGGGNDSYLQLSSGTGLEVAGPTYLNSNSNNDEKSILVDAGTFRTGSLDANSNGNSRDAYIRISTGSVQVDGNVTLNSTDVRTYILFTDAGVLYAGGTITGGAITSAAGGGSAAPVSGTVNYFAGASQTVGTYTYNNLTLSGSGIKTITGVTVNGILSMEGTATASGTPAYGGSASLRYMGDAAQTTGSEFITPWAGTGGILIENASGVTLNAVKTINATSQLTIGGSVANSVLNDGGFQLTSTGTLNLTSGAFRLGSASAATSWPAFGTQNISAGTTAEYSAGIAQTVSTTPAYRILVFSEAGTKTVSAGTLSVAENWSTSGGAAILSTNNSSATIGGNISGTGAITSGSGTITVSGDFTNSGLFTPGTGTVNYNGNNQQVKGATYYNLTISNGSAKTLQAATSVNRTLTLNSGILQIGNYDLYINYDNASAITGAAFSSSNMIATDGSGYLYKNGTTPQTLYPVGSGTYYSPVNLVITSGGTAGTIHVRAVSATTLDFGFIPKFWDIKTSAGGKTFTATFNYDPAEINIAPSIIWYRNPPGTWLAPSGTSTFGVNSFTITGTNNITTTSTNWSATIPGTYYSYQTGSWNSPSSWTSDPSGTTLVGNSVPGSNDRVVILSGRTISLPASIASTGLSITIEEGGFLDLSTWQFTAGLAYLGGEGTLKIASSYFPAVTSNTFINAGGGTTEYNANINLPTQSVYNNLQIDANGLIVTQVIDLTLNGDLNIKKGTYQINDNTSRRLKLTVNGNVTVDAGASVTVGIGVTNSTTNPLNITGGTAPFLSYYDLQSHRIVLNGNFTNNGTVRFTNLAFPVFNAFPPTSGATAGFATVYFQGAADNRLLCAGQTDFYNLVVDKGIDQTFKLTIYTSGSSYGNFRLFGANIAGGQGGGSNPGLKKALWIRTGTLVLEGLTIIPSLSEGTGAAEAPAASPNSDFYIPANGALVLNGTDVVVLSTADDYREVNLAYNTAAPSNAAMGINTGGTGCALSLYGKLQINNGLLSTRESGGIITSSTAAGQFIMNNGTVDTKQFLGSTGSASYLQNGGLVILRGRFKRTPAAYSTVANLVDVTTATLDNVRSTSGTTGTFGSFNLNNANNVFSMSAGTIRIYDVCGDGTSAAQQKAFDILSSTANCNVTGGTLELVPVTGSVPANDSPNFLITTTTPLSGMIINRASSNTAVQLNANPLILLNNFTLTSGVFNANSLNVTIGGDIVIQGGTTFTTGTNTTVLNGTTSQTITINLVSALSFNKLTIDKPAGTTLSFAGSQKTINVSDNFRLVLATLNDNGNTINLTKDCFNSGVHTGTGKIVLNGSAAVQTIDGNGVFNNLDLNNTNAATAPVSLLANITVTGLLNLVSNKVFNIGSYNLNLTTTGSISATAFSNSCYIHTSGQSGDGGITKGYTSNSQFVFPLGCFSTNRPAAYAYTPATIGFSSSPATYGSVTVVPVGYEHPATTVNNQSLRFYWRVKSEGITGFAGYVTHSFVYSPTDVSGTLANYVPSLYNRSDYSWNSGLNSNINTGTSTISDWSSPSNSTSFLDADYTAGDASFSTTTKFYSIATGNWRSNTTWSYTSGGAAVPAGAVAGVNYPGANSIVIIENNNTVSFGTPANYLTTANTEINNCASLQIRTGATLEHKI